jgi:hypothetical protein
VDAEAARRARRKDSEDWLAWLLAQPTTVLPAGTTADAVRASLDSEEVVGLDGRMATEDVGGGTRLFVPVFANTRAGAAAAVAALERRHRWELAVLRAALA